MSRKLTCLVADDERPSLEEMLLAIRQFDQLEVIATANNSDDVVKLINSLQPDIAFLDIEMPPKPTIEILELLKHQPKIIFCTAYHQFAIQAFEENAMDYLMKPIQKERLEKTMHRVLESMAMTETKSEMKNEIIFSQNNQYITTTWSDIFLIESVSNYTKFYFKKTFGLRLVTLKSIEEELPAEEFIKINRSQILNKSYIEKYVKHNRQIKVVLKNNDEYFMSKGYSKVFLERSPL
jgi:two-component system, LytTR family, response regulator